MEDRIQRVEGDSCIVCTELYKKDFKCIVCRRLVPGFISTVVFMMVSSMDDYVAVRSALDFLNLKLPTSMIS